MRVWERSDDATWAVFTRLPYFSLVSYSIKCVQMEKCNHPYFPSSWGFFPPLLDTRVFIFSVISTRYFTHECRLKHLFLQTRCCCFTGYIWKVAGVAVETMVWCEVMASSNTARACLCVRRCPSSPLGSSLTTSRPFRHTIFPVAASTNTREGILVTLYLFHSFIWRQKKKRRGWKRWINNTLGNTFVSYSIYRLEKKIPSCCAMNGIKGA